MSDTGRDLECIYALAFASRPHCFQSKHINISNLSHISKCCTISSELKICRPGDLLSTSDAHQPHIFLRLSMKWPHTSFSGYFRGIFGVVFGFGKLGSGRLYALLVCVGCSVWIRCFASRRLRGLRIGKVFPCLMTSISVAVCLRCGGESEV